MEVSRKKERMTGRLSGCGGGVGWVLGSLGKPPSSGVQMASAAKAIVVSSSPHWSPDYLFSGKSPNTGAFILTAEMPARGRKGRRGPPRCGLTPQNVGPEASLTSSYPHCLPGKQRPREAANPKCVVARGNLDTALTSLGKSCSSQRGTGVCLVLIFFKKLGQIRFFKCCSKARRCLNTT